MLFLRVIAWYGAEKISLKKSCFYLYIRRNMSVIGPRPALWNQDVLTAERDKYGANDVKPGLTGWAQINGRDELEIPVKAKLDGEYVQKESLLFDIKCFLGTIGKVAKDDSVVEGGTGEMNKNDSVSSIENGRFKKSN